MYKACPSCIGPAASSCILIYTSASDRYISLHNLHTACAHRTCRNVEHPLEARVFVTSRSAETDRATEVAAASRQSACLLARAFRCTY